MRASIWSTISLYLARQSNQHAPKPQRTEMAAPKQPPEGPPNLPGLFNKTIADLRAKLDDPAIAEAARGALRTIIDRVAIFLGAERGQYRIELTGDMAALAYATNETTHPASPAEGKNAAGSKTGVVPKIGLLVAAGRFELPTKGL